MLKTVGSILKNPKYANAGIGDVKSIATTAFQKGGLPIETGKCMLHFAGQLLRGQLGQGHDGRPLTATCTRSTSPP